MARGRVRFFLDNQLSPKIARALHQLLFPEHSAHHLKDHFPANSSDEFWMSELGKQSNWVIISGDSAISRNPHEVRAWKAAGHPVFFLKPAWLHLLRWESASKLFHMFPDIMQRVEKAKPGDSFSVPVRGKIEKLSDGS